MDILQQILDNEVFPAVGCTEPIACAFAAAAAAERLGGEPEGIALMVDPGTFKNGAAVTVPNSGGEKGNVIAAVLGALIARPALRLEILREVPPETLRRARALLDAGAVRYGCLEGERHFRVDVEMQGGGSAVRCVVADGHTNIVLLEKDGRSLAEASAPREGAGHAYRDVLRSQKLEEVLRAVSRPSDEQRAYIQRGVAMNLAISEHGLAMRRTGYQLQQMMKQELMADDVFYEVELHVASAVDARMGGLPEPVMTSGGSGNQGVLAILTPWLIGRARNVEVARIQESIAVSHAVNAYVKCFTGELSVICGCAVAASISAAVALVYQQAGIDMRKIGFAMDNVIGDLCGIICDGAKPGCAMKIVSGAETAMRSAFMALGGYGLSPDDGVLGHSPEESIMNIGKISLEGMFPVDPTLVRILQEKANRSGLA